MREKTDAELGRRVHGHLLALNLESPFLFDVVHNTKPEAKIKKITKHMEQILDILGVDRTNDSVQDTAQRVAKHPTCEVLHPHCDQEASY